LAQCQFEVPGQGILFICGIVIWCAGKLTHGFESGPVTADLTTTVVHSYKLLINEVKPVHTQLNNVITLRITIFQ